MIKVKLRQAMEGFRLRTGQRLTYEMLAERTGLSTETLQSLAARPGYNPTLSTVEVVCRALECDIADLLELEDDNQTKSSEAEAAQAGRSE